MPTRSEKIADLFIGSSLRNGWPDRLVTGDPPVVIEIKYNGQGLTVEQLAVANVLVKAGWRYVVLTVRQDDSIYLWDYGQERELGKDEFRSLFEGRLSAGGG